MGYPVYTSVPDGDVLPIHFDSFDGGTGASSATTGLAASDIKIYKDNSLTERSSANGITVAADMGGDARTGVNKIAIDLSDDTDSGFYSVGSWFVVVVDSVTIDGQTVRFTAAAFRIVPAEVAAGVPDVNIASTDDIDLSDTQKASVNTEVDNALNTAIPGSPTADSVNQRLVAVDALTESGGGGDLASILGDTAELQSVLSSGILALTHDATLLDQLRVIVAMVEHQRGSHTHQPIGNIFFVDPANGDTHGNGNRGGISDPYSLVQDCHDNAITDSNHDLIILLAGASGGITTLTEAVTLTKRYFFIRGPGRDFLWTRSGAGDTITITADGIELAGFKVNTAATGAGNGVVVTSADFFKARHLWVEDTRGHGIQLTDCDSAQVEDNSFFNSGQSGSGHGLVLDAGAGQTGSDVIIKRNDFHGVAGDAIRLNPTGGGSVNDANITDNHINNSAANGINITGSGANRTNIWNNLITASGSADIADSGTGTVQENNEQFAKHSIATEVRLAELDVGNLPTDISALKTVADAVKLETDKLTLGDAGAGTPGSIIEEIENRPTTPMRGTDGVDTATMRGTDSAALASLWTAARAGVLTDWIDGGRLDLLLDLIKVKTDALPVRPKKNVAFADILFKMVLSSDHVTPATGLSITGEISKDGGAFTALANAEAEIGSGWYKVAGAQAEMNADAIICKFTAALADQTEVIIYTDS